MIEQALVSFFKPIVRFALQRGVGIRGLIEALRVATVEAAEAELVRRDGAVNRNRLSVLTGLYRGDIERIQAKLQDESKRQDLPVNPTTRILTAWENTAKYKAKSGKQKQLTAAAFTELVESVSKTVHAGSILRELVRSGAVRKVGAKYELVRGSNSLFYGQERAYALVADDIDRLFLSAEANLSRRDSIGELHHRTAFDNIYLDAMHEVRQWVLEQGRDFHRRLREYLSQFDQDLNPTPYEDRPAGGKIAVTSFSLAAGGEPSTDTLNP